MILISGTDLLSFTGEMQNHYDTFAQFHNITVIKEPIKVLNTISVNEFAGFGNESQENNYSYIPISGSFNCMTYDKDSWDDVLFDPIPVSLARGDLIIKVKNDCNNYLSSGKNEFVILDNYAYNIVGGPLPKTYFGLPFYYYSLERTS